MPEIMFHDRLCKALEAGRGNRSVLNEISVLSVNHADVRSIGDLIPVNAPYAITEFLTVVAKPPLSDVFNRLQPDIVIQSLGSTAPLSRIYIDVKDKAEMTYGFADSQLVRYFLHLIATTTAKDSLIRRAVLAAAPAEWFERESRRGTKSAWTHFITSYAPLASALNVTLGSIVVEGVEARAQGTAAGEKRSC